MWHSVLFTFAIACAGVFATDFAASRAETVSHGIRLEAVSTSPSIPQPQVVSSESLNGVEEGGATKTTEVRRASIDASGNGEVQQAEDKRDGGPSLIALGILTALLMITAGAGVVTTVRQIRRRHYRRLL